MVSKLCGYVEKQFNFIYKITRVDGHYYYGRHSTNNLQDGYFGSGTRLANSINFHGRDKHVFEIIEWLPCIVTLIAREKSLVNKEMLKDPLCMNIMEGGDGGYNPASMTKESREKAVATAKKNGSLKGWAPSMKIRMEKGTLNTMGMLGKNHTEESKKKLSESHKGSKNHRFGTTVYTDPETGKNVHLKERPQGWFTPAEIKDQKKQKKSVYGRNWYNNGIDEFFLSKEDELTKTSTKGRLGNVFKKIVQTQKFNI